MLDPTLCLLLGDEGTTHFQEPVLPRLVGDGFPTVLVHDVRQLQVADEPMAALHVLRGTVHAGDADRRDLALSAPGALVDPVGASRIGLRRWPLTGQPPSPAI
ncbi:hypothetical protein [Mesobacterium pallidum]|uniref:hypothetical protein n=1 Tax=Mesobacterium pallidum TaxID=2872037 RepID=UPI001EE36AD9|nr:hypothetical protein [Mesobacterium pallidum]